MEGFKKSTKMQCFKEGGSVKYESRKEHKEEMKADIAQDKKIIKKAFKMHDEQEHKGEHTNLSKLRKGGRAKKDCGSVRKYKTGGAVENQYAAKKTAKDIKDIANTKRQKPAMLCGGKSVKKYEEGGSVLDTIKSAGKKLYENVVGTPEQNRIAQENLDKQATKGSKLAEFFGGRAKTGASMTKPEEDKNVSTGVSTTGKEAESFNKKRGGKVKKGCK